MNNFSKITLALSLIVSSQTFSMLKLAKPLAQNSIIRKNLLKKIFFKNFSVQKLLENKDISQHELKLIKQELEKLNETQIKNIKDRINKEEQSQDYYDFIAHIGSRIVVGGGIILGLTAAMKYSEYVEKEDAKKPRKWHQEGWDMLEEAAEKGSSVSASDIWNKYYDSNGNPRTREGRKKFEELEKQNFQKKLDKFVDIMSKKK